MSQRSSLLTEAADPRRTVMLNTLNSPQRVIMRIELLPQAKEKFTHYCECSGITQVAVASHLIDWFCKQHDVVQAAVLGLYPEDIRDKIPLMILKRMVADEKR